MGAETGGNGARSSRGLPEPERGLRLRPVVARGEAATFPLVHPYFEIVYAPLLGPTAVLLARAMARHLDAVGGPTTVHPVELALEVGIRASSIDPLGKRSHLVHAIDRLAHDHIVIRLGDRVLGVNLWVPLLGDRSLAKLPAAAKDAHVRLTSTAG